MDMFAILDLINKGITIVEALVKAGKDAAPAFERLKTVIIGARDGTITDEELEELETLLDQMIEDFNVPL